MKKIIFTLIVSFISFVLQAQTVHTLLTRDSNVSIISDGSLTPAESYTHIYNESCLEIMNIALIGNDTISKTFYSYYSDNKPYQQRIQNILFSSDETRTTYQYDAAARLSFRLNEKRYDSSAQFKLSSRDSFFYNPAGLQSRRISEDYEASSNRWIPDTEDSLFYNGQNLPSRRYTSDWNDNLEQLQPLADITYYYNSRKQLDSTTARYYAVNTLEKGYYIRSGDESNSYLQFTTYVYAYPDTLISINRQTSFLDSADYVKKDSSVYQTMVLPDTAFSALSVIVTKRYYDIDHTVRETDVMTTVPTSNGDISQLDKSFFFYKSCSSILPLTLLNFTGTRQNSNTLLTWQTVSETGVSHYTIQRSLNGEHFATIGKVTASGSSNKQKTYTYTDVNAFLAGTATLFYRLAQTDGDGKVNYSNILTLNAPATQPVLYVYPNPVVSGDVHLSSTNTINAAEIKVNDMRGRTIYSSKQNIIGGSILAIHVPGLAKGMYIITIQSSSYSQTLKISKQ